MPAPFTIPRRRLLAGAAIVVLSGSPVGAALGGQAAPATAPTHGTFVILKDKDTVAVEQFTREPGLLSGSIVQANGLRTEYMYVLRGDHTIEHADVKRTPKQGPAAMITLDLGEEGVQALLTSDGNTQKAEFTSPLKSMPFFAVSFALCEEIVKASHLAVGQSQKWIAVRLGTADTSTLTVSQFRADSASLTMPDLGVKVALSPTGEVIGGTHLTQAWIVIRKP